jgi:antitoxin Phd
MNNTWQLQTAKNQFSQVVNQAILNGPQIITRRGEKTAIVLSIKEYKRLGKPKKNLAEFLHSSPLHGVKLDLTRNKDYSREIDL